MKKKRPYEPPEIIEFPSLANDEVVHTKGQKCSPGGTPVGSAQCKIGGSASGSQCKAGTVAGGQCKVGGTAQGQCKAGSTTGEKCMLGGMQRVL